MAENSDAAAVPADDGAPGGAGGSGGECGVCDPVCVPFESCLPVLKVGCCCECSSS